MKDLQELYRVILDRKDCLEGESYTASLVNHEERVYRKVNEEAYEVIHACLTENREQIIYETGDLLYHLLVLLAKHDIQWEEVLGELAKRRK
jgi:phosphoribosyl-ATP pyrophosphohydrolase